MLINIDLLKYSDTIKVKKEGKQTMIFDPLRKKYLVLTPEELVRQAFVQYLINEKDYPKSKFGIEKGLQVIDLAKRYDLLIYNEKFQPALLVECKASKVDITEKVFEQIARYNLSIKVKYLVVTNGIKTYCCRIDYETQKFSFLKKIPSWEQLKNENNSDL